jgi:cytochrome c oxidase cbb3-type subunit 3
MNPDPNPNTPKPRHDEEPLRPHSYDGIQEYDKKLPNWWLMTFYGAMIFSVGYFACYEWWKALPDQASVVKSEMARIETAKLASVASLSDDNLWLMSQNAAFVESGRSTFLANCASCHKPDLTGNIGPSLVDNVWIHGGKPMDVYNTVTNGVAAKGMPTWGPLLGTKKVTEVVAFVMSHHKRAQ